MLTNGKKRRGERKKINFKSFSFLGILILWCLIILGAFLFVLNSRNKTPHPVFEEAYTTASDLNEKISQIDNAIYESLFQRGVDEKDVLFSTVAPRHEKNYDWDFAELLVRLPNRASSLLLKKIIEDELAKLKPGLAVNIENISDLEVAYNIYVLDLYTHKIRIIHDGYRGREYRDLPKIALIIDDIGYDNRIAMSFINLDLDLSLSVLPWAPHTIEIANEAKEKGSELLLHLPMEPKSYPRLNPGPGALLIDMNEDEIRKIIDKNIKQVPGLIGVNHHMGSCFTERRDKMEIVLSELKKHNLFYVDSRTTRGTIAYKLAKEMGVPAAEKSVFLDNDLSLKSIKFQVERLMGIARYSGSAIGIGHPYEETLKVLEEYRHQLKSDFDIVCVSELVN
jgi:polysaccharide deacetylase 2 family uncharacterized protein YibQ